MGGYACGNVIRIGNKLYGMTLGGGATLNGVIFSVDTNGNNYDTLHCFGRGKDGVGPEGSLVASGGVLYGMTQVGGANDVGNIFSIHTDGSNYTDLSDFGNAPNNGAQPRGSLTLSVTGDTLYGMTQYGGTTGGGNVFSITTTGTNYNDMVDFNNNENPYFGSLIFSVTKDTLYGMAARGGAVGDGYIFALPTNGGTLDDLLDFGGTNDGAIPYSSVILSNGTLYGMTGDGGAVGRGNVFSFNLKTSTYTDLWSFDNGGDTNGFAPFGTIIISPSGHTLYGLTIYGGIYTNGNIFSVSTTGAKYTDLWNFNTTNGEQPNADVLLSGSNLYGMTGVGGANSIGVVFALDTILDVTITDSTNVTCNGTNTGNATTFFTGGTAPYAYLWSDANSQTTAEATGLIAGTYTITVTDTYGYQSTASVVITQPAVLSASANQVAGVTCIGGTNGSAMASLSGGTSPYTYAWTGGAGSNANATGLTAGSYTVTITDACGGDIATATVTITQPSELRDSVSYTNITCNGDKVNATAKVGGGTTPYTYLWSNSQTTAIATGLVAGTYSVSIKDNCGADSTMIFTITQPAMLGNTSATVLSNITCNGGNGGSASVNPSGGNSPYTYMWSDANSQTTATATGLVAGTYTVSITDACGADSMATAIITQPAMLSNTGVTVISNVTCAGSNNGSASVSPSGGSTPYTYLWSDGNSQNTATATGLSAGSYTVNISDACGADSVATVTITAPTALTATIFGFGPTCYGEVDGFAHAHAQNGSTPYTYMWSNSGTANTITGLSIGTYSVSVTDACGSLVTETVTLTQPTAVVVTTDSTGDNGSGIGAASVTASGGIAPYTYAWTPGGETTNSISGLSAGSYCCTVSDRNGCGQTVCVTVKSTLGIDNITNASTINIYPNPTIGSFTIAGVTQGQVIELYNYIGEKISSTIVSNNTTMHFDISNKANGVYLVRILNTDGTLATEKKMIKTQ
jgi:uncharacterized repeat protein (TIGR03803 family)